MLSRYAKLSQVRFTDGGGSGTLRLGLPGSPPLAQIETADFRVSVPAGAATATPATGRPWLVPLLVLVLLTGLAAGAAAALRRRARGRVLRASAQS